MAHASLLALDVEDPSRSYSTPIAQRQHTLGHLANVIPLRRVSYLFEANSFIPAAKLETRFEAIEQQTGTGQSGDTRYQPLAAELYYFQTDHLGTPLEVADSDGNLVWVGQYCAWGQLERAKDGNGERTSTDNPLRFQGQYHDEETGLHYNRFRYYDPAVGRFTTQDPIGLMGGENLYQYAPNPTGWVDPLGLSKCDCTRALGGAHRNVRGTPGNESHHMPADSVSPISKNRGPAVSMLKEDHRQTASWGNSKGARAYREKQRGLIQEGGFREAQQMDIDDIRSKFGSCRVPSD